MPDHTQPEEPPAYTQAATVIIARDSALGGGIEVLMLQRGERGAFPGFWVFPGGKVDPEDGGDDEVTRARSAAVREAYEEVGVVVDAAATMAWSHWTPPPQQPRRFLTWFFVAPWREGEITIDGGEILDHRWLTPADALSAGLKLAAPTIVTLHELRDHGAGGLAALRRERPPRYATLHVAHDDGPTLLWHPDAGYEAGDRDADGPRFRLHYPAPNRWAFERTVPWEHV